MTNDEIITDLRNTKEKLVRDVGFDIKQLIQNIQREERVSAAEGRVVLQPPAENPSDLGFQQIRFAGGPRVV